MIEIIGYLGSALVVASMLMSSVVKLRVINTIGSGIFAAYALMIHSYPTALMNVCLVGINIYNLVKLTQKEQNYDLIDAAQGEGLLRYLLDHYREDIQAYFPSFSAGSAADRDCSIGTYLYSMLPSRGIHTLVFSEQESPAHASYLRKMGFRKENGAYIKKLG